MTPPGARIIQGLGADSLDTMELTMVTDEAFDKEVSDEDAARLVLVPDALEFIRARKAIYCPEV